MTTNGKPYRDSNRNVIPLIVGFGWIAVLCLVNPVSVSAQEKIISMPVLQDTYTTRQDLRIPVTINDATMITSFSIRISFPNNMNFPNQPPSYPLEFIRIANTGTLTDDFILSVDDQSEERISGGFVDVSLDATLDGSGTLFEVVARVNPEFVGEAIVPLQFIVESSSLNGGEITPTFVDGQLQIVGLPTPTLTPSNTPIFTATPEPVTPSPSPSPTMTPTFDENATPTPAVTPPTPTPTFSPTPALPAELVVSPNSASIDEDEILRLDVYVLNGTSLDHDITFEPAVPNATINNRLGVFQFFPDFSQSGNYEFTFTTQDGDTVLNASAVIEVIDVPGPQISVLPSDVYTIQENEPLTFRMEVQNPGIFPYQFSLNNPVENTSLNSRTGIFTFLPDYLQAGEYTFVFSADDGVTPLSKSVLVTVEDNNRLPQISVGFSNRLVVNEGEIVPIQITAFDEDSDNTLSFNVNPLLDNLNLNTENGSMLFMPDYTQAGEYPVQFQVYDGHDTVSLDRTIEIRNVNREPEVIVNPQFSDRLAVGDTLAVSVFATDPDQEPLTVLASGLPDTSEFTVSDNAYTRTALFSYSPTLDQYRERYSIDFTVSDGIDAVVNTIDIEVDAPIDPLFDFSDEEGLGGWVLNSQVEAPYIVDGLFVSTTQDVNPSIVRSGLAIDTFTQHEFVMSLLMGNPTLITVEFMTADGEVFGPLELDYDTSFEFVTFGVDFEDLFPTSQVIDSVRINFGTEENFISIDYIGFVQSGFPLSTPTPNPSFTPTPVPTRTATPTPTRTATNTPTITQTPTITPTMTPLRYNFDGGETVEDLFDLLPVGGFNTAQVSIQPGEETELFSGNNLVIDADPGEGIMLVTDLSNEINVTEVIIRSAVRSSSENASVALIGLNAAFDGQLGYYQTSQAPVEEDEISLLYRPPSSVLKLGLQVVNPVSSPEPVQVVFDNLQIIDNFFFDLDEVPLQPDGSFDEGTAFMQFNLNPTDDGSVQLDFGENANTFIRLSVAENQSAANFSVRADTINSFLPGFFVGEVFMRRYTGTDGNLAIMLTNGIETLATFESGINVISRTTAKRLRLGGEWIQTDQLISPIMIVQNAGPNVQSSIAFDDLVLSKAIPFIFE